MVREFRKVRHTRAHLDLQRLRSRRWPEHKWRAASRPRIRLEARTKPQEQLREKSSRDRVATPRDLSFAMKRVGPMRTSRWKIPHQSIKGRSFAGDACGAVRKTENTTDTKFSRRFRC